MTDHLERLVRLQFRAGALCREAIVFMEDSEDETERHHLTEAIRGVLALLPELDQMAIKDMLVMVREAE